MKLLTQEVEAEFKKVGSQESVKDPLVIAKFFNPTGAGTWWCTEYDPQNEIFFGYASLGLGDDCDEWGSVSLEELESIQGFGGLGIERDLHCGIKPISEFHIKSLNNN